MLWLTSVINDSMHFLKQNSSQFFKLDLPKQNSTASSADTLSPFKNR